MGYANKDIGLKFAFAVFINEVLKIDKIPCLSKVLDIRYRPNYFDSNLYTKFADKHPLND